MKKANKNIDRLTKDLLKEGMVEPSPDLSLRIMDLIMQEAPLEVPQVKKAKIHQGLSPFLIFGILIAYLLLAVALFVHFAQQPAALEHTFHNLKDKLPYILTLVAIAGSFIFYSTLDKILGLRH